jgi:hypothetical protein
MTPVLRSGFLRLRQLAQCARVVAELQRQQLSGFRAQADAERAAQPAGLQPGRVEYKVSLTVRYALAAK